MKRECTVCNRVESFMPGSNIIDDYEGGWAIDRPGRFHLHFHVGMTRRDRNPG